MPVQESGSDSVVRTPGRTRERFRMLAPMGALVVLGAGVSQMGDATDPGGWFSHLLPDQGPGEAMNILLVGTDSRDWNLITPEEKQSFRLGGVACDCTDTIMVVHLSGDRKSADVVSLPRDSLVELPAHHDRRTNAEHAPHLSKINGAWAEGGADLTLQTVESVTGLKIDKFLQVDFRRFMDTVNTLGGVDVCTAVPLQDPSTGLDLAPGTHHVAGGPSLQYVRSRKVDHQADLGRIQRQQRFLMSFLTKMSQEDVLNRPDVLRKLSETFVGTEPVSRGFSATELFELALSLRDLSPASVELATVPISGFDQNIRGIGSTLKWDHEKAEQVFAAVRDEKPLVNNAPPSTGPLGEYWPVQGNSLTCDAPIVPNAQAPASPAS
ncbi:LCP family protein [Streptomyces sp. NPDC047108]|uniref:LCP family protein n=1 Tax=Streptomyces sp. NPDC047108 TaxID=3155025 RepID=UPI0034106821